MSAQSDFFISYTQKDMQWAAWIAGVLEKGGYTTVIQAWDFRPGDNFVLKMQEATTNCRKTILVLSQNYIKSAFCQPEWAAAFASDPTGAARKLIPVRIEQFSPPGLLSQIVYIDLYGLNDRDAAQALLSGVKDSTPRDKPTFPGPAAVPESKRYAFSFTINLDNTTDPFSPRTKNNLREWFVNNCYTKNVFDEFEVTVHDRRIDAINAHLADIRRKMELEQELTQEEEHQYDIYTRAINRCRRESELRKMACTFLLKDPFLMGYFFITSPPKLYSHIKNLLDFQYFDRSETICKPGYTGIDFAICPPPKKGYGSFAVYLSNEKLQERFADLGLLRFGGYASDLGSDLLLEVAPHYYFFLAEEVLSFQVTDIAENKHAMNLLNYRIGLH